jgi:hypothetical protein
MPESRLRCRSLRHGRWAWGVYGVLLLAGCGTDAVGVETCRSIEAARCDAAVQCGLIDDADACKRYSRDHCLHGIAGDAPGPTQVNRCVDTIEALGRCADQNGKKSSLLECKEDGSLGEQVDTVCELVLEPELAPRCQFLIPPEPEPEPEPEPASDAGSE